MYLKVLNPLDYTYLNISLYFLIFFVGDVRIYSQNQQNNFDILSQ